MSDTNRRKRPDLTKTACSRCGDLTYRICYQGQRPVCLRCFMVIAGVPERYQRGTNFVDSETGKPVAVNPDTGKWETVREGGRR